MPAPTVSVNCTASDQNGNPVAGARYRAKLNQTEVYLGFVVSEVVEGVADANGVCVLRLWPNALGVAGSLYQITAVNPDTGKKFLNTTVSVPNSACNLHQILVQAPYPPVDALQQALIGAQAIQAYAGSSRYLGAFATDPTVRFDGTAIQVGDEYFSTASNLNKRWNGTTWQASDISTANLAASGGSSLVTFLQAGTFGVARTVQEKLRDVLHLKDFGLGTVSDITCINRAMADANLLGGADIICPVRNYTFGPTDQLVIPRSVTLRGSNTGPFENTANPTTTLIAATFSITNTTSTFLVLEGFGSKVEDLIFFYPNQVAPTASTPIVYPYTITCTTGRGCQRIRRCTFVNSYNAIEILSGRVSVEDCLIGAFKNDILIDTALDWVELTNVKCQSMWNVFAGALPFPQAIDTWVMNNSAALVTRRVDSLVAVNFSVFGRYIGHSVEDSPITSLSPRGGYGRLTNVDFDYVAYGIIASSCIFVAHGFKYTNIEIGANGSGVGTPGQAAVITNVGGTQSPIISLIGGAVRGVWAAGSLPTQNNAVGGKIFTKEIRGINPFGPLTAPAVPATGVAAVNRFPFPVRVFLAGGTVTNVTINGVGVGNSFGMYLIEPYESIAVSYTGTPSWAWIGG